FVVGDLTYIYIEGKRYFLFCLIDVYSAHIVGYSFSTRMRSIDAQQAARRWIKLRSSDALFGCIHHTDGGSQYFSGAYLAILNNLKALISCAGNCLQNGYAEQRNGLLKHHLLPTITTSTARGITIAVGHIISTYNKQRKQQALGWKSPVEFENHILELRQRPERKLFNFTKLKNGF
ncbi:MAG: transposase, partial [Cryomorphaceae bacterium]